MVDEKQQSVTLRSSFGCEPLWSPQQIVCFFYHADSLHVLHYVLFVKNIMPDNSLVLSIYPALGSSLEVHWLVASHGWVSQSLLHNFSYFKCFKSSLGIQVYYMITLLKL